MPVDFGPGLPCHAAVTTIAISVLRVSITTGMAAAILITSAVAGLLMWRFSRPEALSLVASHAGNTGEAAPPIPLWLIRLTWFTAIFVWLALLVLAVTAPDFSWDGNMYHIPTIGFWASRGYVHWVEGFSQALPYINGYPKGAELIGFVLARCFGTSCLVYIGNLTMLPLGVLGIICLSGLLGIQDTWPCLQAAGV